VEKEFVIVRGPPGVYAGYLEKENGGDIELSEAFCLWRYSGAASLNQLSQEGVKSPQNCKFSISVPKMRLKQIFQVLPCSKEAKENLTNVKRWKI